MRRSLIFVLALSLLLPAMSVGAETEPVAGPLDDDDTITSSNAEFNIDYTGEGTGCIDDFTQEGFTVEEGALLSPRRGDPYDDAFMIYVDGTVYDPGSATTVTGTGVVGAPESVAGLTVATSYRAFDPATLRQVTSFANTGATDATVTVSWIHDLGSDDETEVGPTASGDTTIGANDAWFTTEEMVQQDPALGWVAYGNDDPGTTTAPVATSALTPGCDDPPNDGGEEIGIDYQLTVPAGATCSLLHFGTLNIDLPGAQSTASALAGINGSSTEVADLTADEQASIVNFDLGGDPATCRAPAVAPVDVVPDEPATGPITASPTFTG